MFYRMARKINTSLVARTTIFAVVAILVVTSALLDVVSFPSVNIFIYTASSTVLKYIKYL